MSGDELAGGRWLGGGGRAELGVTPPHADRSPLPLPLQMPSRAQPRLPRTRGGQQHSDGFGKVNVLRKAPALKDGDFTLAESPAILAYLSQKYKTPDHWYPLDMKKRAWVDEYLAWQHSAIRPSVLKIFWLKVVFPLYMDQTAPEEKLQETLEYLAIPLKQLEQKFLQDKPFLVGNKIFLADLVAVTELMQEWEATRKWVLGARKMMVRRRL
ncbi:unnamed protein product [Caretta caretta]